MKLKTFIDLYDISENTALKEARRGSFGAKKNRYNEWIIRKPPFIAKPLKPQDVAACLGVTVRYIEQRCKNGILKAVQVGRQWRIEHKDGTKYIIIRTNNIGNWLNKKYEY